MLKSLLGNIVSKTMQKKLAQASFTEKDLEPVLKQIRTTLLEADVNLLVVKNFLNAIKKKAMATVVEPGQKADEVLLLIIKEELITILGGDTKSIAYDKPVNKVMMVGLQGSGKTTTTAKLGLYAKQKQHKSPLLVACDMQRLAAVDQLAKLSKDADLAFFNEAKKTPNQIAAKALEVAKANQHDFLIFDTAGRLHTNTALMQELKELKSTIKPDEILLVVDAMAGQDIVNVAQEFHKALTITGIIITKLDSDARAGAALSLTAILQVPIKYSGSGEQIKALEVFHPNRTADKILGFGDMLTLAEQAADTINPKKMKQSLQKMLMGKMDLEDLLNQMEQINKMGSFGSLVNMLPNHLRVDEQKIEEVENKIRLWKIMLSSMTLQERKNPTLLKKNVNRKLRIVKGSGRKMDELNKLISEWEKASQRMSNIGKMLKQGQNPFSQMF